MGNCSDYILHDCGCFEFKRDGAPERWPCCKHRGQSEELRRKDVEQMAWEATAMNGWVGK